METTKLKQYRVNYVKHEKCEIYVHAGDAQTAITKAENYKNRGEKVNQWTDGWSAEEVQTPNITAYDIIKAFEKHRGTLIAVESVACPHLAETEQQKRLQVMNDGVLLRQMLETLGFKEIEIEQGKLQI